MNDFNDFLISILNDNIPFLVDNSENIFNLLLSVLITILIISWCYCSIFILIDSGKRIKNLGFRVLLFFLGILTGPFFLFIYMLFRPRITFEDEFFLILEKRFLYNEASKVLVCKNCQNYVIEKNLFCTFCGFQNRFHCAQCSAVVDYDDNFCGTCGVKLDPNLAGSLSSLRPISKIDNNEKKLFSLAAIYFSLRQKLISLILEVKNLLSKYIGNITFFKPNQNILNKLPNENNVIVNQNSKDTADKKHKTIVVNNKRKKRIHFRKKSKSKNKRSK